MYEYACKLNYKTAEVFENRIIKQTRKFKYDEMDLNYTEWGFDPFYI